MLLDLAQKLQETQKVIGKTESQLSASPSSFGLRMTIESLYKRYDSLEQRFCMEASADFQDVCSYRLIYEPGTSRKISSITSILGDFQLLFSLVYDVVKSGQPKQRKRVNPEAVEESSFEFGYTFAGSLGFVFTMPNERLLGGALSSLDEAMSIVLEMTKVPTPEGFSEYAQRLGPGPISALYDWTKHHVVSQYSADIKWRRADNIRAERLVQMPELETLMEVLERTSETTNIHLTIRGKLFAGNLKSRTFGIETEDSGTVSGDFSQDFQPESSMFTLGKVYTAEILKRTTVVFSTGESKEKHFLLTISS